MTKDFAKLFKKLDRPPSGPNWVRFVRETKAQTTKAILSFANGIPPFTYLSGTAAIRDRINLGIDQATALQMTLRGGAPAGRERNRELVEAFFEHDKFRRYPTFRNVEFERGWFNVSRDISVPVSPTTVIRENGKFVPIFLCGWSHLPLDLEQRRLLVTICDDAFLSLTDYQTSPAEFLFFPIVEDVDGNKKRQPEIWNRGDYDLLSESRLSDYVELYLAARKEAFEILTAEMTAAKVREEENRRDTGLERADDLFGADNGPKDN